MTGAGSYRAVELRGDGRAHPVRRAVRAPGPGELRIEVRTVGLCATDKEVRDGTMVYFVNGMAHYPVVPGHEWVGTVVAAGPDTAGFTVGDRVVGECSVGCGRCTRCTAGRYHLCARRRETGLIGLDGALAEEIVFPAAAAHVVPVDIPDEAAALLEPAAVAYNAVAAAEVGTDDRVLVVGAGPIGLLALQVATTLSRHPVSICDLGSDRLARARTLGAGETLLVDPGAPFDGGRWDRVIEASGRPGGVAVALAAARPGAVVVCVSLYGRPVVPVDLDGVVTRDITLRGALGSPGCWPAVLDLVAAGRVTPAALVTRRFPLDRAAEALDRVGDPHELKIVVDLEPTRA
jgi:L-iditol 2-dehydrogenase